MSESAPSSTPATPLASTTRLSCLQLFITFTQLGLSGFGGVLPWAHQLLVEKRRWLSNEEFVALVATGQILPGPNIFNMSIIFGQQHQGWRGSLAATGGLMLFPLIIVLVLGELYIRYGAVPQVGAAIHGMGAVSAGLIVATAYKMSRALPAPSLAIWRPWLLVVVTFIGVGLLRYPLFWVLLALAPLSVGLVKRGVA